MVKKISVIIPTFNRAASLKKTLETLVMQDFDSKGYIIYVIDNNSTDQTKLVFHEIHKKYPDHEMRYYFEPVPGLLAARHLGAMQSNESLLVFIDDDILATHRWLSAIYDAFKDPTVQLVGGRNLPKYDTQPPPWLPLFWDKTSFGGIYCGYLSLLDLGKNRISVDANYIWGLNFAIRRKALFDLGGFHPDIVPDHLQKFQGDGETGLTMKANMKRYRAIYEPGALIYHQITSSRLTVESFEKRSYYQGICDSYSNIRLNNVLKSKKQFKMRLNNNMKRISYILKKSTKFKSKKEAKDNYEKQIIARLQQAYLGGYKFHQDAAKKNNKLIEWILRKDYWDYHFPDI